MADVADNGLVLHLFHVFDADDVAVSRGGHVNIRPAQRVFHRQHAVAFHSCLKGADGVYFRHDHLGSHAAQGLGAALAHVPVAADDGHFAGNHHVRGALDAVHKGLTATVQVVKLGLGYGIVYVDGRNQQTAGCLHLVQAVHAGGRFLGNAFQLGKPAMKNARSRLGNFFQQSLDDFLFFRFRRGIHPVGAFFHFIPAVDKQGGVSAVVHNQLRPQPVRKVHGLPRTVPVFPQRFPLPGENGGAGFGDGGGGVVLGGENVAARPADGSAQSRQRFYQHGRLHRHVQGAHDAHALQGSGGSVLFAHGHQAGHLMLRNIQFLASEIRQADIAHLVLFRF